MKQPCIHVNNLSRRFGKKLALDDVSLSVEPGIVVGMVGANGAGKTTLIKHLLGLLRAKRGTVRVFGLDPVSDPVSVLGRIGYVSEERDLPDWMLIGELMNYNKAFYDAWDVAFAEELCNAFELNKCRKIKTLSRGQRARANLLVALAHRPDLLVLDEPSSGLDPVVRKDILHAVVRTVADEGRTVIFSSHLLEEVERVADRLAVIDHGRLVLYDSLDAIQESHCRLTLQWSEAVASPTVTGALCWQGEGKVWTAVCNGRADEFREEAMARGARIVEERTPSLDEIFMAYVR